MAIVIASQHLESIRGHGIDAYPEECCGILGGSSDGAVKTVEATLPLVNRRPESRHNRYFAPPEAIRAAEAKLRSQGHEVIGFYHSHPNAPARPSPVDLEHATWPWFSYVIVAVADGKAHDLTSWTLAGDRSRFDPEEVENRDAGQHEAGGRATTPGRAPDRPGRRPPGPNTDRTIDRRTGAV